MRTGEDEGKNFLSGITKGNDAVVPEIRTKKVHRRRGSSRKRTGPEKRPLKRQPIIQEQSSF